MLKKLFFTLLFISGLAQAQMDPKIVISPMSYDMGDIKEGDKVTKIFTIKNEGSSTLNIKDVKVSCGCTAAKPKKNDLEPGESTEMEVTFNSSGREGKQSKTVYVETNDPANSSARVTFTANVLTVASTTPYTGNLDKTIGSTSKDISSKNNSPKKKNVFKAPRLSFMEKLHDFGRLPEGKVAQYTFNFVNTGELPLSIEFVLAAGPGLAAQISNREIAPGGKGTLKVSLDTSNLQGKVAKTIKISSNDIKEPSQTLIIKADIIK